MRPGLSQTTQLKQELKINPRLYQAMDLLYMPLLDLEQHLKQELLGNPFLEMVEPEEEVQAPAAEQQQNKPEKKEEKGDDEPDWENILLDDRTEHGVPSGSYSDAREYVEPVTVEARDLIDYLREQTRMLDLTPRQQLLAEEFLGNIGEELHEYLYSHGQNTRFNLCAAMCDTACSLISQAPVVPLVMTTQGDFGLIRKAERRSQVLQGQFDKSAQEIVKRLADLTGLDADAISVKGTTSDGLGFAGGEGIAAFAVATVTAA